MTKILTREAIQRMMRDANNVQRGQGSSGSGGGGGQAVSLANLSDVAISTPINDGSLLTFDATTGAWVNGRDVMTTMWNALEAVGTEQIDASHLTGVLGDYATETWVSQNYISIAYFDRLFRAYNGNTIVNHNDTESTITSIEAMFGFWTEQYLSALGNSGGGSVSLTLANMGDVALNNLADGQVLTYNATTGKWVNANPQGGVTDLASLTDVTLTTPSANQVLLYDGTTSKWKNSGLKTINGESIFGTGNIVVGGGGSAYLPLAGGTMTGTLVLTQGVSISSEGNPLLVYRPSGFNTISNIQWGVGANNSQGVIRSSASDLLHWRGGGTSGQAYAILDEYNATSILNDSYLPLSGGSVSGSITPSANASFNLGSSSLWWNRVYTRYIDTASGYNLRLCTAGTERLSIAASSGNVGIGTTSPSYKLHVNGTLGAGNTSVANLESEGYVSALSDIRKKDVVEYMDGLTIEQIAKAPIIKFLWKERPEDGLQVGSIAQYWEKVLPQSVHKSKNDYLSFSYGVAALVGTISNSRELVKHDARLSRIEKLLNINID